MIDGDEYYLDATCIAKWNGSCALRAIIYRNVWRDYNKFYYTYVWWSLYNTVYVWWSLDNTVRFKLLSHKHEDRNQSNSNWETINNKATLYKLLRNYEHLSQDMTMDKKSYENYPNSNFCHSFSSLSDILILFLTFPYSLAVSIIVVFANTTTLACNLLYCILSKDTYWLAVVRSLGAVVIPAKMQFSVWPIFSIVLNILFR